MHGAPLCHVGCSHVFLLTIPPRWFKSTNCDSTCFSKLPFSSGDFWFQRSAQLRFYLLCDWFVSFSSITCRGKPAWACTPEGCKKADRCGQRKEKRGWALCCCPKAEGCWNNAAEAEKSRWNGERNGEREHKVQVKVFLNSLSNQNGSAISVQTQVSTILLSSLWQLTLLVGFVILLCIC